MFVVARAWLRPAGALNTRRYAIYGTVVTTAAAALAVAGVVHHSWMLASWAAVMAVATAASVRSKTRRAGPTESVDITR